MGVGLSLAVSSPAAAAPAGHKTDAAGEGVGVAPIVVHGRVPAGARERLARNFEEAFARADVSLRPAKGDDECESPACFGGIARRLSVDRVVALEVTVASRDYDVRATLRDASGEVTFEAREKCEICGLDEVEGVVESVAARVAGALRGPSADEAPRIRVLSSPAGADVRIDQVKVGSTPYEGEVESGEHVVGVYLAGHVAVEREMAMEPGVMSTAEFELAQAVAHVVDPRARPWGALSLGVGLAAVGGGLGLLALPPRAYERKCSGDNVDADGDCRYEFNTRWGGAALLAAGGVLVTIGVMLLVRYKRGAKSPAVARLMPTGTGLRGSF